MEGTTNEHDSSRKQLPERIPLKYSPAEVEGNLTEAELVELNGLVDLFPHFTDENDPRVTRWLFLDTKARGTL